MTNTRTSFKDKWEKNPQVFFQETLREDSETYRWIITRNGFSTGDELRQFLADKRTVLDAGCGNGRVTALLRMHSNPGKTGIVGIDMASADVAKKNLAGLDNVEVLEKNLLSDLSSLGKFDFIYCQEVLHHTGDPKRAFLNLCSLLEKRGEIAIYVYRQKAPVREFVDDFVREKISGLDYNRAMQACEQITELGRRLSEASVRVSVPTVEVLGIQEGDYDLQRFVYHFFMKCFWNSSVSFHDNAVVNYDWYHPQEASRHTLEEVREWFGAANLKIVHENVDFYGITVRGAKK